jgi:hypothetical protein
MHDVAEKERRGYTDPRTRVYFDGRERLAGKDWIKRKHEVWERGRGQCEKIVDGQVGANYVRCRSEMHDPHHIQERSRQRDDRMFNLIGLCRMHHDLEHEKRSVRFGEASRTHKHRLIRSKLGIG